MTQSRSNNFDDSELTRLLADIKDAIDDADCSGVLVVGDMNCHFQRNTRFTVTVQSFFQDINFEIFWESSNEKIQDVDYTHLFLSKNTITSSTVDHFAGNHLVINAVSEAGVIHHLETTH